MLWSASIRSLLFGKGHFFALQTLIKTTCITEVFQYSFAIYVVCKDIYDKNNQRRSWTFSTPDKIGSHSRTNRNLNERYGEYFVIGESVGRSRCDGYRNWWICTCRSYLTNPHMSAMMWTSRKVIRKYKTSTSR